MTAFDTWREGVAQTVAEHGFAHAWEQHFLEIVQAHHSDEVPDTLLGHSLYSWIMQDPEPRAHFESLPEDEAEPLRQSLAFDAPAPNAWDSHRHRDYVQAVRDLFHRHAEDFHEVAEADGRPMQCVRSAAFQNWGRTVQNVPYLTCIPRTKIGVCNLVKWAAANGKTVRVSGYRHTWSDLYSADNQVLVSLLPLNVVEDLPAREPGIDPHNELQGIKIVGTVEEDGVTKGLCKIGAATTNEQFRRWCLNEQGGNWDWTVPLNVIMVEITWGGSNGPICHGAGWRHPTLSDLVTEIEFVNARGELQVVSDPEQLRSAAGCFGLLGVVTALTLKLDPMSYAVMQPIKPRVALTIPPPPGVRVPAGIDMTGISEQDLQAAWTDFVNRCENDYYSEWFWFPYNQKCWVNTWKNDGKREDAKDYPSPIDTIIQETEEYLGQLLNTTIFKRLPGDWQARLLGTAAMAALPENQTIVTPVIDALHFRRGIQNMRVLDMEFEIPIPPRGDDPTKPDWTVCQKAWWDVISNVYKGADANHADAPMRVALEMRITAGSNIIMAPQFGNHFGTCSIEVLTTLNVPREEWLAFMQEVTTAWDSYTDPAGNPLNVRPHWAKQWQNLVFRGMSVNDYLRTVAYKDRIPEFKARLQEIAQAGGYTLADLQRTFSNPLLDDVFELVPHPV